MGKTLTQKVRVRGKELRQTPGLPSVSTQGDTEEGGNESITQSLVEDVTSLGDKPRKGRMVPYDPGSHLCQDRGLKHCIKPLT